MEERKTLIPQFGPFSGLRIVSAGSLVAMPHAGAMLADFGAEVIHIERPNVGDTWRFMPPFAEKNGIPVSTSWMQDGRNRLSMTLELNLNYPEVKELFYDLIRNSDVFMENMVWLDKLGISDEDLLKVNPKLVIAHVSGYGRQEFGGLPNVCGRASYDMIGQAFSGFMHLNGEKEPSMPALAKPWLSDYISGLHCLFGVLAAYFSVLKTGKGQVVDIAQYEANARILADNFVTYTEIGKVNTRMGTKSSAFQPYGLFVDKDGQYVAIGAFGAAVYKRFINAVGFDIEYFNHKECASGQAAISSEKGIELDKKITQWCTERTAEEIVEQLSKFKVPCCKVNNAKDCVENEHFKSRENFVKYVDQTSKEEVTAFGVIPKLSETPGKVWRGAPLLGQDTDDILTKILEYSEDKIKVLREKNLI